MPLTAPGAVAAPKFALTGEQQAILDASHDGHEKIVVEALAGTGKTSTLKALAASYARRPGVYLAFNSSVKLEAAGEFPEWVHVTTAHGLAYQAIGKQYGHRLPGNHAASRMGAQAMASRMKVRAAQLDSGTINPVALTRMAQATVNQFMKTADPEILPTHIPDRVLAHHSPAQVSAAIVPVADKIWADLQSKTGAFRFTHDAYLKMWQLGSPRLPWDYIMFDEAQDADPVISAVVAAQGVQKHWVGDRNQAIYGWRGAVDAMSKVAGAVRLPLTQSWRFGQGIADLANDWLKMLGSQYMLQGNPNKVSGAGEVVEPHAVLCRGNGTALGWVLMFHAVGMPCAIAPGDKNAGKDIERFAWAAKDLMTGQGTDHPDLCGFQTWSELVKYVEEEEDTDDLKRLVGIINRVGISAVIDAVRGCVTKDKARVTVSTSHKAKGLQWPTVRIADDFAPPLDEDDTDKGPDREAWMLNYVAVTRAEDTIQLGGLEDPSLWDR
jgi:hypothetical protein